ncbi:MAG TPA: aldo/keto reductase [Gammaproteobacteria bacterium]|nr:aldo/keto reductase [Gammaproteobacteria bacterium]
MKQRTIGRSGLRVSEIGLGCNNFGGRIDFDASREVVHAALDAGINFFDTADGYGNKGGSERILGRILSEKRNDVVIATKCGATMDDAAGKPGASRRYIMSAVEDSLRRLDTDWIDLYYIHWPDPQTPIDETLRALDDLIHQGKVRYIGSSNFPAWQAVEAEWVARELGLNRFICAQNEYSLLKRDVERELLPALAEYKLGLVPYFPLANGLLTGKYQRDKAAPEGSRLAAWSQLGESYVTEENWNVIERLEAFCAERNHCLLELAFSWLLAQPQTASVIAGATKPEQIRQNAAAADWRLSADELDEISYLLSKQP